MRAPEDERRAGNGRGPLAAVGAPLTLDPTLLAGALAAPSGC